MRHGLGAALILLLGLFPVPGVAAGAAAPSPAPATGAEEARSREQAVEEDPLAGQQERALEEAQEAPPDAPAAEPNEFEAYASVRLRYRFSPIDTLSDGGSRFGLQGRYQVLPRRWLFARGEAGFNVIDEFDALFKPGDVGPTGGRGNSVFRRLLNVGYESPNLFLVAGKTWSTYYRITSFTDRFFGTGGRASGTYNAGTDGGFTGTGRAEQALQTRLLVDYLPSRLGFAPFSLNVQVQEGRPIPNVEGVDYGYAIGLSAMLATEENFSFGVAYNRAEVTDLDRAVVRESGIDGDAEAIAVGARWFDDRSYLGTVVSRLLNHEATDEEHYFDGWGWEVYAQYRVQGDWWLTGGWNWLRPDADQDQAGDYRVQFAVAGLRYALDGFDKVLFVNHRVEGSRSEDGSRADDVTTVGIRWNF